MNYNTWLEDNWHTNFTNLNVNTYFDDIDTWMLDDEDNSVQIATQKVIEAKFTELYDYYKKPTVIIGK